ncbi:filamentous hemagglutinin N-terminal domain-containing protein, partial [Bisgaard Taxon 10/6]|uniref:two-partner secretion domain-containing protein n=1 Tax=Exercitatus varius TaxID=67857 RepID=UPI00294B6DA9
MNKNKFRVIFNRTLQRLVVTSELARSADKSIRTGDTGEGYQKSAVDFSPVFVSITPLAFRLFCMLGFVSFSVTAQAGLEIRADKMASPNQQPIVLSTANGLPQVNIQTPNSKGLSHNKYAQFDVDTEGAILNNSRQLVQTQQGGLVAGNPYLARGEARVILNEVNSANPSLLKGYVEVAGKKADVIIANPNGINCEGCGIINSSRATLTTGKPQLKDGLVDSFAVEKGRVKISGKGLDNSRVDYTEIIAREAEINSGVWSDKKISLVTGQNTVKRDEADADNLQIIHTKPSVKTAETKKYALDVSELGGMYAGKIQLIGTEQGLGVRNEGHIGATAGDIDIDSQGRIINGGTMSARQNIRLNAQGQIDNRGVIEAHQQSVQLITQADINHQGRITAHQGNIRLKAKNTLSQQGESIAKGEVDYQANKILANENSLIAAGVTSQDTTQGTTYHLDALNEQGKSVRFSSTEETQVKGKNIASGEIHIDAGSIALDQSETLAYRLAGNAKTGAITASYSNLNAVNEIRFSTPTQLVTERANLSSDWIAVAAHAVNNTGGMWTSAGNQDLSLNLKGGLINRAGFIQTGANMSVNTYQTDIDNRDTQQKGLLALGVLTLQGRKLDNANGQLVANRAVALQMQAIGNREGLIRSQQENVSANSTSSLENQSGQIIGKTGVELIHQGLNNIQGIIAAEQGALNISVGKYNVNNTRGQLLGGTALYVEGNKLVNQGGMIFAEDTLNLRLKNILDNRKIMPTGSLIQSGGTLQIQAQQIDNSNTKPDDEHSSPVQGLLGGNIRITAQQLNNFQGGIYAENELRLESTGLAQNQQGELLSNGNLTLSLPQGVVENENGAIQAAQNLFMNAHALRRNGQIQADHTHIQLTEGFNSTTDIIGRSGLNFSTQGALVNQANFSSQGSVTVRAQSLDNRETGRISARYTDLTVGSDLTNRGLIKGAEQLNIRVGNQLNNIGSGRIYGGNIALQARKLINQDERFNNKVTSAVIAAIQRLDIGALEISNEQNYLSDEKNQNGVGTTISSEGGIVFGARLNGNNQATGEADKLRNVSALIEGKNIHFGVKSVENINKHLQTRVEQINEEDNLNEHYLLTDEVETGERINFDLLKWVSYSRAGKVIPKNTPLPTKRPENEDYSGYIIPMPNEESCVDESTRSGCVPNPNALYLPDDPVWKVMGVPAPTNKLNLNLSDIPADLERPEKPTKPRRRVFEGQENYQARVQQYEKDKEAYEKALAEYNKKLAEYGDAIQPYLDWMEQNEQVFLSLGDKIQAHNAKIIGREFYRFWDVYVTNRVERQTLVKETKPGQILSEKEIRFTGDFLNNRSQVIAGERIYNLNSNTNKIRNEDEEGLNSIEERGTQQWTYSKWRGGTKRYHERRWGDKNAYLHYTNTTIALNLVKTEEFGQVTRQTLSPDLAVSAITLNPLNTAGASLSTQQEKTPIAEVRFIRGSVQLPTSSLYKLNPQANDHVLIETDPDFTDQRKWLSSDYMFTLLRTDHEHVHKRLGDGYYEQRLVREQINQLTGRYFLGDYANFENQYKALMNNGATFAQKFNLTVGVSLSPEQVSQLTSDIVWLENQTVRLPNGETQTVLVPRVYMMAQQDDITGERALISAQEVSLEGQSLTNEGVIAGRKLTFDGTTLSNSGLLTGQTLALKTTRDINQQGGTMEAENALLIDAGGNLNLQSTTQSSRVNLNGYQGQETHLDRKSTLYVKGDNGLLRINADNINLQGAEIRNDGEGATWLAAKNDINLTALSVGFDEKVGKGDHSRNESAQTLEISHVKGKGDVILSAGNNINTEAAQLESEQKLALLAENSLVLGTAETSSSLYEYHKYKSGGGVTKTTKTTELSRADETQQGTQLSADTMVVAAGKDITATAVQLAAEHDVNLIAGNNVSISAGTNHFKNHYRETKKTSGVFGTGGIGVTIGSRTEKHNYASEGWTQSDARSTLGSVNGDLRIHAENHAQVLGTDIIAADNRTIDIQGQSLNIEAGKDVIHRAEQHEYKQSGLTVAFSSPVTDMAVVAVHTVEAAKRSENPRLRALYALKAAQQAKLAEMAFDGSAVQGVLNGTTSNGSSRNSDAKISLSVGSSKSTETSMGSTVSYTGSELNAGDIRLSTTAGDLSVSGSTLTAAHIALDSARN